MAPVSYHPLWDELAPSIVNGIDSSKLDHLQYLHTQDNLLKVGVGDNDSSTYGHYHLHSAVGCVCQFDRDSDVDRVGISIGLSSPELLLPSAPTVSFQMILSLILVIWMLVLQMLIVQSKNSMQFYPWDPSGL